MTEELRRGFSRNTACEALFDLMCANARVLRADLAENKHLRDDLNLDSFDFISIVSATEGEFEIAIADEELERLKTVGDVCNELWNKLR